MYLDPTTDHLDLHMEFNTTDAVESNKIIV